MTIDSHDLLNSILKSLDRIEHIKPTDLPNIELYMDQVTTFMDERLKNTTRNPGGDKILTKTMINNYAKNNLLPSPNKKKYSKEHMLLLIFIYYFKGVMSIGDIQTLLTPLTEKYFGEDKDFKLEDICNEVFSMEKGEVDNLKKDVVRKFRVAEKTVQECPDSEKEFLQMFSFICQLCFDIYIKKLLVEKIIDSMNQLVLEPEKKPTKSKVKDNAKSKDAS